MSKRMRETPRAHIVRERGKLPYLRGRGKPSYIFTTVFFTLLAAAR